MSTKADWYAKVESILYEVKTYDYAIYHMQQRGESVEAKIKQKNEMSEILNKLPQEDQDFIRVVYMADNTSPQQLQMQLCMSEATYFRRKRQIVKNVAQYFGYI